MRVHMLAMLASLVLAALSLASCCIGDVEAGRGVHVHTSASVEWSCATRAITERCATVGCNAELREAGVRVVFEDAEHSHGLAFGVLPGRASSSSTESPVAFSLDEQYNHARLPPAELARLDDEEASMARAIMAACADGAGYRFSCQPSSVSCPSVGTL